MKNTISGTYFGSRLPDIGWLKNPHFQRPFINWRAFSLFYRVGRCLEIRRSLNDVPLIVPDRRNRFAAFVFIASIVLVQPNLAFAWGCIAAATAGNASGESRHYDNPEDARKAAMQECSIRTDEICEIVECDYDK